MIRACYTLLLVVLLSSICQVGGSQVIADALPGCLQVDQIIGTDCNQTPPIFTFGVVGGRMEVAGVDGENCCFTGGDHNSHFTFEPIDISCYSDVMITMDHEGELFSGQVFEDDDGPYFTCQNSFVDNSHDQIQFAYLLDGVEILDKYVEGTTEADFTGTWTTGPINGDVLQIKIYVTAISVNERIYLDNLQVTAVGSSVDAGLDQDVCNGDQVNLSATGSGEWSGGAGSFSDITDPSATYTPAASEANSTVTLTFSCSSVASCAGSFPPPMDDVEITFDGPTATLAYQDPSFSGDFCSGDCETLDVVITGGTPLYELQMSLSVGPVTLPNFPVPGFAVGETITICYDESAFIPSYDNGTRTITVPGLASGFSGTVNLSQITDANGCMTSLAESVTASFQTTPELDPGFLAECPDPSGFTTFILSDADSQVDAGGLYTINYFEFNDMTGPLNAAGHVVTGNQTVYAFATEGNCSSDPAPVTLTLLPAGNVGAVEFYCDVPTQSTSCLNICDIDGSGSELVELTVTLPGGIAGASYELEYEAFPGGRSVVSFSGTTVTFFVNVSAYTAVEIISITELGLCTDFTDLGGIVELNIVTRPQIDFIPDVVICSGSYVVPQVPGTNLSANATYYTLSGGQGAEVPAGTVFTSDTSLYAYDGVVGCDDEAFYLITIGDSTTYDTPMDVNSCGVYTLPAIAGSNVGGNAMYYTGPGGTGSVFAPGETLSSSVGPLFVYDPTSSCQTNEPSFSITIAAADTLQAIADTIVCDSFRLLPIISSGVLSGDQAYYTAPGGQGDRIAVDSLLLRDSVVARFDTSSIILYAYDSLSGCRSETSFRLTFGQGLFAGRDTSISFCSVLGVSVDLVGLVGMPDTGGVWSSSTAQLDLSDPSDVSLALLPIGSATATYTIVDSICGNASATVSITVDAGVFAGLDGTFSFCENEPPTDLFLLMAAIDQSGTFSTVPDVGFDFSVPQLATFSGLTSSAFDIIYIVQGPSAECPADTATLSITVNAGPDAGRDSMVNVCQGSIVDLNDLISGVTGGDFTEVVAGSGLTLPSTVNTTGLTGSFAYNYIVTGTCGRDTALLTIAVSTSAVAGDGGAREACDMDQPLDLTTLLSGADGGGQFYIDGAVVPSTVTPSDYTMPSMISYIVGDGVSCDFDTATFIVSYISADFDLTSSSQAICPDRAQFVFIDYLVDRGYTIYLSTTNVATGSVSRFTRSTEVGEDRVTFQVFNDPDGIENGRNLEPDELYIVSLDSVTTDDGSCTIYFDDVSVPIRTASVFRFELDTTLCLGDSVLFLNRYWTESFYDSLQTTDGCDSIIDIQVELLRRDTMTIDGQRCEGFTLDVDGNIFDQSNTSGEVLLTNSAGCDSLVVVDLTFAAETTIDVTDTICDGGQVVVAGEVFDATRTSGMVRSDGMGSDCDTIFNVALTIGTSSSMLIDDVLCDGASIMVGVEVFDVDRPRGTVMLSTATGCDSIVEVDLTFDMQTIVPVNDAICEGDTLFVNGNPYYLGNASGTEQVNGINGDCDTIYQIALEQAFASTSTLEIFTCDPDSIIILGSLVLTNAEPAGSYIAGLNSMGCDSIVEVTVTYGDLGLDVEVTNIGSGSQLMLTFPGPYDLIQWSPPIGLSCTDCPDPIATPTVTTDYFVYVESNGCIDSATVAVRLEASTTLDFPSIISPDGSAGNDVFYVKAPAEDSITVSTMIIYDRWGNQVFSVANVPAGEPAFGWNGTHHGEKAANGVYAYYLELSSAVDPQFTFTKFGDITVLR